MVCVEQKCSVVIAIHERDNLEFNTPMRIAKQNIKDYKVLSVMPYGNKINIQLCIFKLKHF